MTGGGDLVTAAPGSIAAFNTKCDKRLTNLFLHSSLRAKCEKRIVFRFPHRSQLWKMRKTVNGKRARTGSFFVFHFQYVRPLPNNIYADSGISVLRQLPGTHISCWMRQLEKRSMVSFSVFIDTELNEENKSTVYTRTQQACWRSISLRHLYLFFVRTFTLIWDFWSYVRFWFCCIYHQTFHHVVWPSC